LTDVEQRAPSSDIGAVTSATDPRLADALAAWLPSRRWFAGKHRLITGVEIELTELVAPVASEALPVVLVVAAVELDDGGVQRYAIPVATLPATTTVAEGASIALLPGGDRLVDALAVPAAAASLIAAAFTEPADGQHRRGRRYRTGLTADVADPARVRALGAEQSNTSLLVGDELIAKIVRRLDLGRNPDAELPAHLAAVGYRHAPGLVATLAVGAPGRPDTSDIVIVHDAIVNEGDLWSHVLTFLATALRRHGRVSAATAGLPLAELLGRRTAELHRALATPPAATTIATPGDVPFDSVPVDFTLEWQRQVLDDLTSSLAATQASLADATGLGDSTSQLVEMLLAPPATVLARFTHLADHLIDARRIRVHGDLHLGQILWTGDAGRPAGGDVVFIDFEGEPGTPIPERAIKRSPLTDVAGLVRSFDYATRSAVDAALGDGTLDRSDAAEIEADRAAWTKSISTTFVDAYLAAIADTGLVPARRADADLLLAIHVLLKGLYEVRYELANRPAWVAWPLTAVTEMLSA
jgi:maltose alpha-D-glucosyltransferase/alpha-amylase